MSEAPSPKKKRTPRDLPRKRKRPPVGGLGHMSPEDFPFVAVVNGKTMFVDREMVLGKKRITFTEWI